MDRTRKFDLEKVLNVLFHYPKKFPSVPAPDEAVEREVIEHLIGGPIPKFMPAAGISAGKALLEQVPYLVGLRVEEGIAREGGWQNWVAAQKKVFSNEVTLETDPVAEMSRTYALLLEKLEEEGVPQPMGSSSAGMDENSIRIAFNASAGQEEKLLPHEQPARWLKRMQQVVEKYPEFSDFVMELSPHIRNIDPNAPTFTWTDENGMSRKIERTAKLEATIRRRTPLSQKPEL